MSDDFEGKENMEFMIESIMKAMEKKSCRMISATIIAGNICAGKSDPLSLEGGGKVIDMLRLGSIKFGQHVGTAMQTTMYVWAVSDEIREEIFGNDELTVEAASSVISAGGVEWYMLNKMQIVDRSELGEFFQFVKDIFIECAQSNKGTHDKYDHLINAFDNIITVLGLPDRDA